MKKIISLIIFLIGLSFTFLNIKNDKEVLINKNDNTATFLSMMVENDKGEYEERMDIAFPKENYIFNPEKSGCENGGNLSWNKDKQKIEASLLTSDKCYAYFDKYDFTKSCKFGYEDNMACELIKNKDNTLIYHDGKCDYEGEENCDLEAEDNNYRYSGASEEVNNYVCLDNLDTDSCESDDDLYRIIGLFKNSNGQYEMKLIKAQGATTTKLGDSDAAAEGSYKGLYNADYSYSQSSYKGNNWETLAGYYWNRSNGTSSTNMWQYSNLNKINLNKFFYNYITTRAAYLQNHITEHTWTTGGMATTGDAKATYDAELGEGKVKIDDVVCYLQGDKSTKIACTEEDIEYPARIGLMYVSDYMYGISPTYWTTTASNYNNVTSYNWLYSGMYEWTISRYSSNGYTVRFMAIAGDADYNISVYNYGYGVRPSFYLTSDAKIKEGEGSKGTPYRIIF